MGLNTIAVGTHEVWVIYDGPAANAEELQKLEQAGIAVPNGRFQSDKLTYKVTLPKQWLRRMLHEEYPKACYHDPAAQLPSRASGDDSTTEKTTATSLVG